MTSRGRVAFAEIIASGDGEPCAPDPDRPMREWVFLVDPDEDALTAQIEQSRAFLESLARPRDQSRGVRWKIGSCRVVRLA